MEKDSYQEIIDEVNKKLADKITSEEKDLDHRTTLTDRDFAYIVQDIGLKTCKQVLEKTRDQIAKKKEMG